MTLGLFEKTVLADTLLAASAEKVFAYGGPLNSLDARTGVLAFSGQIFFALKGDTRAGHPAVDAKDAPLEQQIVHPGEDRIAAADGVVQLSDSARIAGTFLQRDEFLLVGEFGEALLDRRRVKRLVEPFIQAMHDRLIFLMKFFFNPAADIDAELRNERRQS